MWPADSRAAVPDPACTCRGGTSSLHWPAATTGTRQTSADVNTEVVTVPSHLLHIAKRGLQALGFALAVFLVFFHQRTQRGALSLESRNFCECFIGLTGLKICCYCCAIDRLAAELLNLVLQGGNLLTLCINGSVPIGKLAPQRPKCIFSLLLVVICSLNRVTLQRNETTT